MVNTNSNASKFAKKFLVITAFGPTTTSCCTYTVLLPFKIKPSIKTVEEFTESRLSIFTVTSWVGLTPRTGSLAMGPVDNTAI
ncbi:hypothetical protein D3C74_424720 [compost metagenome]